MKRHGGESAMTVIGVLSRVQTTLDLYTDEDLDQMIAAQEKYLDAVGFAAGRIQSSVRVGEIVGKTLWKDHSLNALE